MENQPSHNEIFSETLHEEYQAALLKTGIRAASLLTELLELKIMPDPRAKEMADIALEVIKLINSSPLTLQSFEEQPFKAQEANE